MLALARAAGFGGMIGGQVLDLEAEQAREAAYARGRHQAAIDEDRRAAALCGRRRRDPRQGRRQGAERRCRAYGHALGAAFQVADDILDVEADEAALGKRAGKDADRNKATLVAALGLEAARKRRDALAAEAIAALDSLSQGCDASILKEAARFVAARAS